MHFLLWTKVSHESTKFWQGTKGTNQSANFWDFWVLRSKFTKFLSFLKQQIGFSSNFASIFGIMRLIKVQISETFECSDQNSPSSCHFWNNKSVFLQTLHHSSVSWDIILLYFYSWNFIYFQQKEHQSTNLVNFTWAVKSLKFCTLMGYFYKNHIKFWLKKYRTIISLKSDSKFKEKLTCGFKYHMRNSVNFHPTTQKSENLTSMGYFCPKYMRFEVKMQRSHLLWHWAVMQNLNKLWPCGFINGMRNWVNFH